MLIKLGYSYQDAKFGIKTPFIWDTDKVPHAMIAGVTGGGKTVLCQLIVNQLMNEKKKIYICDFKAGGDWDDILSNGHYAEYIECDNIMNAFYESFVDTIRHKEYSEKYIIFDEFSSYMLSKEAKDFKRIMAEISHLSFMSRSFGYHMLFISQQFSSRIIDTAIREQFSIRIYMGSTISTESAAMLFPNCEIDKSTHLPKCCGYISTPEQELDIIQIPFISEPAKLKKLLMKKGKEYY